MNSKGATGLSVLYAFAGALVTILLLEFMAVTIEVTDKEVRFCMPFYCRKVLITDIQHWQVRNYPGSRWVGGRSITWWQPPKHCIDLTMQGGVVFTITSNHAERLDYAITKAKEMNASTASHLTGHNHPVHS